MGIAFLNLLPTKAVVFPLSGINTRMQTLLPLPAALTQVQSSLLAGQSLYIVSNIGAVVTPAIFFSQAIPGRASFILPWVRRSAGLLELPAFTLAVC